MTSEGRRLSCGCIGTCPHSEYPEPVKGRTPSPHERCHERAAESYDHGYLDGLRAAREAVARQTDLAELVHFERPSDFRKGVLTCVVALDNEIKVVTDA